MWGMTCEQEEEGEGGRNSCKSLYYTLPSVLAPGNRRFVKTVSAALQWSENAADVDVSATPD